uniref:Uncharacterized protein n=1 Tax=Anguilla anguilla TaxID=7936 RepID=A0A0E9QYX4_ANGAN
MNKIVKRIDLSEELDTPTCEVLAGYCRMRC